MVVAAAAAAHHHFLYRAVVVMPSTGNRKGSHHHSHHREHTETCKSTQDQQTHTLFQSVENSYKSSRELREEHLLSTLNHRVAQTVAEAKTTLSLSRQFGVSTPKESGFSRLAAARHVRCASVSAVHFYLFPPAWQLPEKQYSRQLAATAEAAAVIHKVQVCTGCQKMKRLIAGL